MKAKRSGAPKTTVSSGKRGTTRTSASAADAGVGILTKDPPADRFGAGVDQIPGRAHLPGEDRTDDHPDAIQDDTRGDAEPFATAGLAPDMLRPERDPRPGATNQVQPAGAASAAQDPVVLIEIDPGMSGGYVHNRYDVMIRGRAIAAASIEAISLQVGERIMSVASYGQPERAAIGAMPDGTPARQRGFQFSLPRQPTDDADRFSFQIVARTVDGVERAETFTIEVDPTAADAVTVISGPTRPAITYGGARPYILMYIERGTIDSDGNMTVQGWAVALGSILAVQLFAGDERISAARLGGEREDVAMAYPAYPNARLSGFNLTIQIEEEDRQAESIRAQVICPNGFAQEETIPVELLQRRPAPRVTSGATRAAAADAPELDEFALLNQRQSYRLSTGFRLDENPVIGSGLLPPTASSLPVELAPSAAGRLAFRPVQQEPTSEIRMFCDEAELRSDGTVFVNGWAVCAAGIAQIRVMLDDRDVGLAVFGHDRADVGSIYRDIPMASLSGFKFEHRLAGSFDGEHVVRVVVRNARNEEKEDSVAVVVTAVAEAAPQAMPVVAAPEVTAEQAAEFRFELDSPALANGAVIEPVTGRLTIDGWLLSRTGIASFEVFLDDQRLGDAHYGQARQDVGAAFPEWPNSLRSGYAFHCPPRSLRDGDHTVTLKLRANSGLEMTRQFQMTVKKSEDQQDQTGIRRRIARAEADLLADLLNDLDYHPAYRFILRLDGSIDAALLNVTLESLRLLAYTDWSVLVLAETDDAAAAIQNMTGDVLPRLADRFSILRASDGTDWNAPLGDPARAGSVADTRLYMLLVPGDELGADALLELAVAGGMHRDADMLYGDEVRLSPVTKEREPFFKPDYSPDLLYSTNYIGRPWAVAEALLAQTGVTPAGLLADGEYDLALRCAALARKVHHVTQLLCQRSPADLDDPAREQAALQRMLARGGVAGDVLPTPIPGTWRVRREVAAKGKVSIIIPTCAGQGHIKTCIQTLRAKTAYPDYEIVCIDNIPPAEVVWKQWLQQNADKVVDIPGGFNWSIFNNRAAEVADGEYLLFLNDDMEIVQDDWLDAMMEHAQRPEVGVTGPQLLYPDGKVQHAGMFLSSNGIGRHAFRFAAREDPCYFGLALTQRNVIAVTGACMLVRRETFDRLGRFVEAHEITNNDLDLCLRMHRAGLLTVFTPYATLIHYELASRATMKDVFDLTRFDAAWKTLFAAGDPYFSPRLSRHNDDYRPDDEPVQWITPGSPLFHRDEIERILVVKLDHIGDFVTALQPIRRLREIFPKATVTVLAGRASRAFASVEAGIDEFIPFDFFHARSQLGERQLEKDDFIALQNQLRPYRFDLAVDLRKHLSTRDVLKHSGARFLAGFDYLGQFPYLDVALDWDGDRTLQRKRSHIIDDLLGLVNAIGQATRADRVVMQPPPAPMPRADLPEEVQALFVKPVLAVHPGAGNVTKQWPTEHFTALIDLLVERNDVNILLVGGPDEVEVANSLLQTVQNPNAVASMAGKTSLADLPRVLLNCMMYIGNDSGPKHIAAAIGLPTIGVHSGVVDPVEWGPLGPRAVALRRNMTCSPCYLAKAEDCPRALACLRFLEPNLVYEAAVMLMGRAAPAIDTPAVTASSGIVISPTPAIDEPDLTHGLRAAGTPELVQEGQREAGEVTPPTAAPTGPVAPAKTSDIVGKSRGRARRRQSSSVPG